MNIDIFIFNMLLINIISFVKQNFKRIYTNKITIILHGKTIHLFCIFFRIFFTHCRFISGTFSSLPKSCIFF